ncbi:hypothetical protein [Pseudoduganella chitinolytica]|uniref:DUF4313 domain-containing protein n=1 Tax=Pseudoduganella chitinolytica TaxID=34070 RepID=A0ABY8B918_9BURK|nr:hypothetical protein [Pseudoduganella chitinolytica]WEF32427.1 hypothetical protein PX653_23935 [Pseudoduganella chitinolytica]
MSKKSLYILKYTDSDPGCPTYMAAELSSEPEWDLFVAHPDEVVVEKKYALRITDGEITDIDFDMDSGDQRYVSAEFLKVCNELNVPHRAIPLRIELPNGDKAKKDYFFFLPKCNLSLLDRLNSDFQEEVDPELGGTLINGVFGTPIYSSISKFIPLDMDTPNLFFCVDIFELVCSDAFRLLSIRNNLKGVAFLPLDESYRYNPFNSLPE